MTSLPADNYINNASRTVAEQKVALESLRDVHAELPGGVVNSTLTIATGSVTPTAGVHIIDTEAAAASDDLANIVTTNHPDGRLLLIRNANNSRSVVVKHNAGGAGQIALVDSADLTLSDTTMVLCLQRVGADWKEVFREYGNNKAADRAFWGIDQVIFELIGGHAPEALTISAGDITPTYAVMTIDTEGAAASDNLDHILQTNLDDGRLILIRAVNASRDVVVRHAQGGAGEIQLRDAANLTLAETTQWLFLERRGTSWYEIARFGFVAKIADGGTNNGSLGVSAAGIYVGDGTKVTQLTGTSLQQFRVNIGGTAIEAFTPGSGSGGQFGADGTRSLPTSGAISGVYYHTGNWASTGTLTAESGTRIYITGSFTLTHVLTVSDLGVGFGKAQTGSGVYRGPGHGPGGGFGGTTGSGGGGGGSGGYVGLFSQGQLVVSATNGVSVAGGNGGAAGGASSGEGGGGGGGRFDGISTTAPNISGSVNVSGGTSSTETGVNGTAGSSGVSTTITATPNFLAGWV